MDEAVERSFILKALEPSRAVLGEGMSVSNKFVHLHAGCAFLESQNAILVYCTRCPGEPT